MIKSCDSGSLPFKGDSAKFLEGAQRFSLNPNDESAMYFEKKLVESFLDKIRINIDVPNYPQFRDMNEMFLSMVDGVEKIDAGYLETKIASLKKDDSKIVELSAARALSQIGDQRGIDYLIQMLRSNNPIELRKEAAKCLGNLANPKVIEILVEIVNIEEDDSVYNELIETFKKMGSIAVDPLIKILTTTSDKKIRTIVSFLLEKIGKPAVDPLIQILKIGEGLPPSHPEYQAIQSLHGLVALPLINIGEPAIDPLIQLLNYTMFAYFGGKIMGILKNIMEKPHLTEHYRLKISKAIDNYYERIGMK